MKTDGGILLESGTGEVEILHFTVNNENYAINVVKVKEILHIDNLSKVPNTSKAVPGISLIRGDVIPIIDMKYVLEKEINENVKKSMILLCEFNKIKVAFSIDEVLGITRIKWSDIQKPSVVTSDSLVIGNINLESKILMLLDFEKIVMDISPKSGIHSERMIDVKANKDRSNYKLVLADDSPLIRKVLLDNLTNSGFNNLRIFDDGQQALDYINSVYDRLGDNFMDEINLLITDIEMPQLDGHTLTRTIKEHRVLRKLPVIIFSSLITGDLRHKGESVGADAQMSKPEVENLVETIDTFINIASKNK